jgi:hypothetical protein
MAAPNASITTVNAGGLQVDHDLVAIQGLIGESNEQI